MTVRETAASRVPAVILLASLAAALGVAVWSWSSGGVVSTLLSADLTAEEKVVEVQAFFAALGWGAPLVYFLFVVIEVIVAPIPGAMLYAPGGLIFGGFLGGLLSLAGNTVGAGLSCWMIRTLGGERLSRLVDTGSLAQLQDKLAERGFLVILLLRINPLTSSDLVSYAAGLTRIPIWHLMLATMLGMTPLCFGQSYLSAEIFTAFPKLIYPLAIAGIVYAAVVVWVIRGLLRSRRVPEPAPAGDSAGIR